VLRTKSSATFRDVPDESRLCDACMPADAGDTARDRDSARRGTIPRCLRRNPFARATATPSLSRTWWRHRRRVKRCYLRLPLRTRDATLHTPTRPRAAELPSPALHCLAHVVCIHPIDSTYPVVAFGLHGCRR